MIPKYWSVTDPLGGYTTYHDSYDEAVEAAKQRAHLAPQSSFVLSEAMLEVTAEGVESMVSAAQEQARLRASKV